MQLVSALLCDFATVREGLLHLLGGGITRMWRANLPAPLGVSLALVLQLAPDEAVIPHEVQLTVTGPDGSLVAEAMGGLQIDAGASRLEPGEDHLVPVVIPLQAVGTTEYGRHRIEVSVDATPVRRIEFWVLHPEEQLLPPLS